MTDSDDFLRIDEYQLDKEWVEQPALYFRYSRKLADAERSLDEAKADLELCKAQLDKKIRDDPERYNIAKVSESAIASAILTRERYKEKLADYNDAKHTVAVLKAACVALTQRKAALENMVDLHGQSYFSKPREKGRTGTMKEVERKAVSQRGQYKRKGARKERDDD